MDNIGYVGRAGSAESSITLGGGRTLATYILGDIMTTIIMWKKKFGTLQDEREGEKEVFQ